MDYRRLGRTGIPVSRISLGMMSFGSPDWAPWTLGPDEATGFVRHALERGITAFDTADFYSHGLSEIALGTAIRELTDRAKVVVTTKAGLPMFDGPGGGGLTRKRVLTAIDESLARLGTDYVDVFLLHEPDPRTPLDVTLAALDDAVRSGRALHAGVTNFAVWQHAEMQRVLGATGGADIDVVQVQYNLAYREDERELLPLARARDMGVVVYSPLARGLLARRPSDALTAHEARRRETDAKARATYGAEEDERIVAALARVADGRGLPPAQIALAWVLSKPEVTTVLSGALEREHIDAAVDALDVVLDEEEIRLLEADYRPRAPKTTGMPPAAEPPAGWWRRSDANRG